MCHSMGGVFGLGELAIRRDWHRAESELMDEENEKASFFERKKSTASK